MTGSLSMIFIDITVVGVALPQIRADLGMSDAGLNWVMSVYTLVMACLVAFCGRIADMIGRVPAFIGGVVVFALASLACGFAGSEGSLIAGRACQGVGAALMQPASGALVISAFARRHRGKVMAIYVGIPLLFMVIGPLVGGFLTQAASWRWCFWVNLPVAAAALILTAIARPLDARSASWRIDPWSLLLLMIGLPALILAVQQGNEWGWMAPWSTTLAERIPPARLVTSLPLAAAGAVLLVLFIRRQWRSSEPLLALGLFRDRGLLANALILFMMQFTMTGLLLQGSVYAQEVLGFDPRQAGASLLPLLVPILFVVHVAGRLYDRIGVRTPAIIGTALATAGGLIAGIGAWLKNYPIIGCGFAIMGVGIGFVMSPTNTDSLNRVPADARAQVSGLMQTMRHVGGTTGLAVIGAAVLVARTHLGQETAATAVGYGVGALGCGAALLAAVILHRAGPVDAAS